MKRKEEQRRGNIRFTGVLFWYNREGGGVAQAGCAPPLPHSAPVLFNRTVDKGVQIRSRGAGSLIKRKLVIK